MWDERPRLPVDLQWVWVAREELSTCRAFHMGGPGPIPWSAIHEWARHRRLTADEEDALVQWVWALDAELLRRDE